MSLLLKNFLLVEVIFLLIRSHKSKFLDAHREKDNFRKGYLVLVRDTPPPIFRITPPFLWENVEPPLWGKLKIFFPWIYPM